MFSFVSEKIHRDSVLKNPAQIDLLLQTLKVNFDFYTFIARTLLHGKYEGLMLIFYLMNFENFIDFKQLRNTVKPVLNHQFS